MFFNDRYKRPFEKGDLHVQFDVLFPDSGWADETTLKTLKSILPSPAPLPKPAGETEEVVLGDVDHTRQQQRDATDEDDERGGPQVQCAQQ